MLFEGILANLSVSGPCRMSIHNVGAYVSDYEKPLVLSFYRPGESDLWYCVLLNPMATILPDKRLGHAMYTLVVEE